MKNILVILVAGFLMTGAFGCKKCVNPLEVDNCIDPSKINRDAACYMIYDPVCGCDGKTYGNDCVAANNGVKSWTKGECNTVKGNR